MIWDQKHECMGRKELDALQLERLRKTVATVYDKVAFYTGKLDEAGVKPGDVKTLADLARLPFTCKDDLRDNYPLGLLAVKRDKVREIHGSSGTTGKPIIVAYTEGDIDNWSEVMARTLASAGSQGWCHGVWDVTPSPPVRPIRGRGCGSTLPGCPGGAGRRR